jgi:hypothetical protein
MKTNADNTCMHQMHSLSVDTTVKGEKQNKNQPIERQSKIIALLRERGSWKSSNFISVLESIQFNIMDGVYTTIDDCVETEYFNELSRQDQNQLIDIALWYLHNVSPYV